MVALVAFVLFLIFSPWGNIKLGSGDEEPAFTFPAYFSMIYSTGIAAGIVFWGPAEAIFYFGDVPPLVEAEAGTTAAAVGAVRYTSSTGASRRGVPTPSWRSRSPTTLTATTRRCGSRRFWPPFVSLDDLDGGWAKVVDILAVFATIGGIAATLGSERSPTFIIPSSLY